MRQLFISDLHLSEDSPELGQKFDEFLQSIVLEQDHLYILGDFFQYWLGKDCMSTFDQMILDKLASVKETKNLTLYFLPGNRDFLLEKSLLASYGIELLEDPSEIHLGDALIRLGHGDAWVLENTAYQRFRKIVRSPMIQTLFRRLPVILKKKLARIIREKSRRMSYHGELEDVSATILETCIKEGRITHLIHGHTHNPILQLITSETSQLMRIALSDWGPQGNYLELNNGEFYHHYF